MLSHRLSHAGIHEESKPFSIASARHHRNRGARKTSIELPYLDDGNRIAIRADIELPYQHAVAGSTRKSSTDLSYQHAAHSSADKTSLALRYLNAENSSANETLLELTNLYAANSSPNQTYRELSRINALCRSTNQTCIELSHFYALNSSILTFTRDLFDVPFQHVSRRSNLYVQNDLVDRLLFGGQQLSFKAQRCESLNRVLGHGVSKAQATAISTECWPHRTWSSTCNQKHSYTQSPNVRRCFACQKTLSTGLFTKGFSKQYRSEANTGFANQQSIDTSTTSIAYNAKVL